MEIKIKKNWSDTTVLLCWRRTCRHSFMSPLQRATRLREAVESSRQQIRIIERGVICPQLISTVNILIDVNFDLIPKLSLSSLTLQPQKPQKAGVKYNNSKIKKTNYYFFLKKSFFLHYNDAFYGLHVSIDVQ